MKTGTKSVLFGIHNPFIHSYYMCKAWGKIYGWNKELLDPRLHFCFLLHDIGYWGCETMDGPDGELHPIRGSQWVRTIFGDRWGDMCLLHSGTMVEIENKRREAMSPSQRLGTVGMCLKEEPSKLYAVDKLASPLYPAWLYKLLSGWSDEWKEYAAIHYGGEVSGITMPYVVHLWFRDTNSKVVKQGFKYFDDWHVDAMRRMKKRAWQHAESGEWMTMQEAVKHDW